VRLVIVGGVAAGTKAAARARRVDPDLAITLFQDEPDVAYSGCGQPYVLSGVIADPDALIIRRPEDFARDRIDVRVRHRVTEIDLAGHLVHVHDLESDRREAVPFDRLILATGARPIVPELPGVGLAGVATLRGMAAMNRLLALLDETTTRQAVVVGGGYVGLEVVEALVMRGLDVSLLERDAHFPPRIDPDIAEIVRAQLHRQGVRIITGESLVRIDGRGGHAESALTSGGNTLPAQLVVLALGVRPAVELAAASGIRIGPTGAVAVDERMATSAADVYAAGDCVEARHRVTDSPCWLPLGDIANLQGRVAGENAAGGDARFPGVFGTSIFKCFELAVGSTGLTEAEACRAGFDPVTAVVRARDAARYYPDARPLTLKLVAEASSGRLLGAQAAGTVRVDKLIDIAATAMLGNLTCDDLQNADLAYAPPFSPVLSPIAVAAGVLAKKQR
jgi:NADPH-dependent 2,4-dienoyl-CoA reductase/sulfur reductase-like enzyme